MLINTGARPHWLSSVGRAESAAVEIDSRYESPRFGINVAENAWLVAEIEDVPK